MPKKYILRYSRYGFDAGAIYTHEGDYLIHRDPDGEVLHKILEANAYEGDFQDVETIDEHKVHKELMATLVNKTLEIRLSCFQLGDWFWEGNPLEYKLVTSKHDHIYALIPQWNDRYNNSEGHRMLDSMGLQFKGDDKFGKFNTLREDFKKWFDGVMERNYIGAINFYIKDIESIEHSSEKITSITLKNKTKIFINYDNRN